MKRETTGTELSRLVAVLDALIKWSVARPQALTFHNDDSAAGVLAFECVDSKALCWSARTTRGAAPQLEIYPSSARTLTAEARMRVMETLNAYSRQALNESDRLRIGFGALKNDAALAAVTDMLGEVLTGTDTRVRVAS
jgi:hypothetical protein